MGLPINLSMELAILTDHYKALRQTSTKVWWQRRNEAKTNKRLLHIRSVELHKLKPNKRNLAILNSMVASQGMLIMELDTVVSRVDNALLDLEWGVTHLKKCVRHEKAFVAAQVRLTNLEQI